MAQFDSILPNELMADLEKLEADIYWITDEMLEAAARKVKKRIQRNMRKQRVFKSTHSLEKGLKITKVYETKTDNAKNIKIGFYGYDRTKKSATYPKGVPIPLIALAREYGTSSGEAKRPFLRKSFVEQEIEKAMNEVIERELYGE